MIRPLLTPGIWLNLLLNPGLILALVLRWIFAKSDRRRTGYVLGASMLAVFMVHTAVPFMDTVTTLRPMKYDLYILNIDRLLGYPGLRISQVVVPRIALLWTVGTVYGTLHLAMITAFTATVYLRPRDAWLVLRCFILSPFLALPIYMLIPVCGPIYALPNFPIIPHPLIQHPLRLSAACNGVPSLHMSTALLALWFLRHWRYGRIFGITFAVLTVFATLGNGQHYVFDLLCAVPFAAMVYWCGKRWPTAQSARYGEEHSMTMPSLGLAVAEASARE